MDSREIRAINNLSQKDLAKKYGIPYRTITEWDTRKSMKEYMYNILKKLEEIDKIEQ